ncbi:uncharacterized protein LOC106133699 [Amyelois transitella]|uniref:uncharacterized protein LOC106133699 n=1 Tax=Amyelois transitella TaxID=680683 RepID=UPI00067B3C56|nr:uncharacterized protein LOC106133699 [Amyelois transitella]
MELSRPNRTSQIQFSIMVEFMEKNGDLSKPTELHGRIWRLKKWRELTKLLNLELSGSTRSESQWRKTWSDFKNNTKKKYIRISRGSANNSRVMKRLTDLERRVLAMMSEKVDADGFESDRLENKIKIETKIISSPDSSARDSSSSGNDSSGDDEDSALPKNDADHTNITNQNSESRTEEKQEHTDFCPTNDLEAFLASDRRMQYELEKERLRQRNVELDLQGRWLKFMNDALGVMKDYLRDKK